MVSGLALSGPRTRWDDAFEIVDQWLSSAGIGVIRLGAEAVSLYPTRRAKDGWRVPVAFGSEELRFDVLVGDSFPFDPPRIALVDRPEHLSWPHVEHDGFLCLLPGAATVSIADPVAVLKYLLSEAVHLVEKSTTTSNLDDFRDEFLSYWPTDSNAPRIRSLLEPRGPSRSVSIHRLKGFYIVAEDKTTLTTWLNHAIPQQERTVRKIETAILLWLDKPMLPSDYPGSSTDVISRVRLAGLGAELDQLGAEQLQRIIVIFGAVSENGPAFAAVILGPKAQVRSNLHRQSNGDIERGFRPGRTPQGLLARRHLTSTRASKAGVERFDAAWIHGRDRDPELSGLQAANVVIVGCGSLGGPIALSLAQAGVGSLDLIDPELLRAANVGRHPLGASEVGMFKAKALVTRIKADYPHIRQTNSFPEGWETVAAREPERLLTANLIISTIGDWSPEAALNAWRQDRGAGPDLLFGWTEPHAVAGHAVGLVGGNGCLACGLSDWGEPLLSVAAWPNGTGQRGEPACGVLYQPYGPVEIAHTTALIAEAAIDILLNRVATPFHRIRVARETILDRAGGVWSETWISANEGAPKGGRIDERAWERRPGCRICGTAAG